MDPIILSFIALLPIALAKPADFRTFEHPVLCEYDGLTFFPGEDIYQERSGCKIRGIKCGANGKADVTEHQDCDHTVATTDETTTTPTTTPIPTKPYCLYEGATYHPGQQIYEGRHESWCFAAVCSDDGRVIQWDDTQCNVSTTAEVKATVSTVFYDLPLEGCVFNGMFYMKGEKIKSPDDECAVIGCGEEGITKARIPDC